MDKDIILFYPIVLILIALILRKISFGKVFDLFLGTIQIIIANIVCIKTVTLCRPGDWKSYIGVFNSCSTINDCFIYSPFEKTFTYFIGFSKEFLSLDADQIWSLINFINLILITLLSFLVSKYFSNKVSFLPLQTLLIGTTFNNFLTISIRSGLSFLLVSLALYKIINLDKNKSVFFDNLLIFTIFALSITIHVQSILLIIFCFVLLITKYTGINIGMNDEFQIPQGLIKGFISKKILNILLLIALGNVFIFFNFRNLKRFIGKAYYRMQLFGPTGYLGIRSIAQQFIIYYFILLEVRNSSIYKENRSFSNFFQLLNLFQITSLIVYYSILFVFGIDGFARQMQYNFLLYIVIYISSIEKFNFINILPFAFLIYEVYYAIMNDVSFSNPFC